MWCWRTCLTCSSVESASLVWTWSLLLSCVGQFGPGAWATPVSCVHACIRACVCVCMRKCVCVHACACVCGVHVQANMCTCQYLCIHRYVTFPMYTHKGVAFFSTVQSSIPITYAVNFSITVQFTATEHERTTVSFWSLVLTDSSKGHCAALNLSDSGLRVCPHVFTAYVRTYVIVLCTELNL